MSVEVPLTERAVVGVDEAIPSRELTLSQTKFEPPPKLPELLNCTCVFEPPGVPPPPEIPSEDVATHCEPVPVV